MKKILSKVFVVCLMIAMVVTIIPTTAYAKVTVPKISIASVENIDTTTQKISWEKVSGVSGYELYQKNEAGKFVKIKTLSKNKTSYTVSNLEEEKKYFYKIRAYKKVNGNTKYGKLSSQVGKKTTCYLTDLYEPYDEGRYNSYHYNEYFESPYTFSMGGLTYSNGFILGSGGCYYIYNILGKYNTMTFTLGTTCSRDLEVVILSDDDVIFTAEVAGSSLPKQYTVDLQGASKLEFRDMSSVGDEGVGFAEIKLYK